MINDIKYGVILGRNGFENIHGPVNSCCFTSQTIRAVTMNNCISNFIAT